VAEIGGISLEVARAKGAEYLSQQESFEGHEICAKSDSPVTAAQPPAPTRSEWGRGLSPSALGQGQIQEVLHPNAFGQQAQGDCLGLLFALVPGEFDCSGGPGRDVTDMTLDRTATTARGREEIRSALLKALISKASRAKVRKVLAAGGYRTSWDNEVGPGRLLLAWYKVPPRRASRRRPRLSRCWWHACGRRSPRPARRA
jgi:hypothetical protein